MTDRLELARQFLQTTDWAKANDTPLAGDASNRSYRRLRDPETGDTAVLMNAPPEKGEDVRPFIRIAQHLTDQGLSAPRIFAADKAQGFLLLEDLGDDLFARVLEREPDREAELYEAATDALVHLHQAPLPDQVPEYSLNVMPDYAALIYDWYIAHLDQKRPDLRAEFLSLITDLISVHAPDQNVLVQRDYHAENLLWLPQRSGVARVGLLDFQDGARGHRAYDLVSVLQDARRDVSPQIERAMIARYVATSGVDKEAFEAAYNVLGAQRNLRILGVFVRLGVQNGKTHYLDFIPRVWDLLMRDFQHPALHGLRDHLMPVLPPPSPENIQRLKDICATVPAQ